ncbi:hypothetical protein SLEP1_g56547 [Rubroshorea leprosula]|uniref:Uncharacterized protein n=1 Tax=Rubroshorea leprosula TaxID=152421 RepID=A0AAV5MIT5_9ROSI|nr:hypothetical protein SLEP1_g56547 [Rubroshorea leprosula]
MFSNWLMEEKLYSESACETTSKSMKYGEHDHVLPPDSDDYLNLKYEEGFKKLDSLNHWNGKELGDGTDVDELHMLPGSGALRGTVENENGIGIGVSSIPTEGQVQTFVPGPSTSQDQLFSIVDFSPNWAYVGSATKVLIVGRFMKSPHVLENCKWSCMFGKVEVPAEVIADGVLCCHTPTHEASRVPFYIMSSNGLACSEMREFEFRTVQIEDINAAENYNGSANDNLQSRFDNLLSSSSKLTTSDPSSWGHISQLSSKISSLLKVAYKELEQMLKTGSVTEFSFEKFKDQLLQKHLKEKLYLWILQKVAEGGDGPSILDEGEQGVLHLAAALGYDWALEPTVLAGVSVDFRDVNGWTALHWAAFCGREHTVASLSSLGAATRALTHPLPKYPSGRTCADLASVNGHKGIAGLLADCSLDVHIPSINLDHQDDAAGPNAVQKISEISAAPLSLGNASDGQSQKDSLAPTCDAATAPTVLTKIVLKVDVARNKQKHKAMTSVCSIRGIDHIIFDMKTRRMQVVGAEIDPVVLVGRLRKIAWAEVLSVGPAERNEGEKDEVKDDEEGPDKDKGPNNGEGPKKDEGPEKEKQEGKKRAPDPALESGKACKILKVYLA